MAKVVMLSDEVYEALSRLKHGGESFTEVIARSIGTHKKEGSLLECAGLWRHLPDEKVKKMKEAIAEGRRSWREVKIR